MSYIDNIIEQLGAVYTLKSVIESVDSKGYSVRSYTTSQVKCIFNELTGLEYLWDIAGPMKPGDAQIYFKTDTIVEIGDILQDEDYQEWEIIQIWNRKYMNRELCQEAIGRKK